MQQLFVWQIALRYLRGKRSANAVPILSRISMVAIAVCSGAMLVMFSVFNGFDSLVKDLYKAFSPDIKISVARGKFFPSNAINFEQLRKVKGIQFVAPVIEDNALAGDEHEVAGGSGGQHKFVTVKGINNDYFKVNNVGDFIVQGVDTIADNVRPTAILGSKVGQALRADVANDFNNIMLYCLNPEVTNPEADPANAFQSIKLHPVGIFDVQGEFDDKYILAPIVQVQELFHAQGKYSSIEIKTDSTETDNIKKQLKDMLGPAYKVESRFEQNNTLYMMMGGEKKAIYVILLFVLLVASFNMIGALSMLVIEKQKDIAILRAMGATTSAIRTIFLFEGVLWSGLGALSGIVLGSLICIIQQQFKIIKMADSFAVEAFPVKLLLPDVLIVFVTIIIIGVLVSWYPSMRASKTVEAGLKSN